MLSQQFPPEISLASPMVRPAHTDARKQRLRRPLLGLRWFIPVVLKDSVITGADMSSPAGSDPFESYGVSAALALRKPGAFQ